MVRTGADGCIYSGCDFWAYTMPTATQERPGNERQPAFGILGNPASGTLRVKMLHEGLQPGGEWVIVSPDGRALGSWKAGRGEQTGFDISGLAGGLYFLSLRDPAGQALQTERFVILSN